MEGVEESLRTRRVESVRRGGVKGFIMFGRFSHPLLPIFPAATKGNHRIMVRSSRPAGATNKVFDHEALPLDREDGKTTAVEEPYYHTLDGSEQKARRPPTEPLYTTPFSDVNNKKK